MKVELWFGGFVNSYDSMNRLRKVSLRSHLGANLNRICEPVDPVEGLIRLMDADASSWRMGVPDLLRGYFDDMLVTLRHCKKLLGDGKCFIVVGNSAFAGVRLLSGGCMLSHWRTMARTTSSVLRQLSRLTSRWVTKRTSSGPMALARTFRRANSSLN